MAQFIRNTGESLLEVLTVTDPTQIMYAGAGNLIIKFQGITVATLNASNNSYIAEMAGDYTLSVIECCGESIIITAPIIGAATGPGTPVASPDHEVVTSAWICDPATSTYVRTLTPFVDNVAGTPQVINSGIACDETPPVDYELIQIESCVGTEIFVQMYQSVDGGTPVAIGVPIATGKDCNAAALVDYELTQVDTCVANEVHTQIYQSTDGAAAVALGPAINTGIECNIAAPTPVADVDYALTQVELCIANEVHVQVYQSVDGALPVALGGTINTGVACEVAPTAEVDYELTQVDTCVANEIHTQIYQSTDGGAAVALGTAINTGIECNIAATAAGDDYELTQVETCVADVVHTQIYQSTNGGAPVALGAAIDTGKPCGASAGSLIVVRNEDVCAQFDGDALGNFYRMTPYTVLSALGVFMRVDYYDAAGIPIVGNVTVGDDCNCPCVECGGDGLPGDGLPGQS